jgi:hypothetical protein
VYTFFHEAGHAIVAVFYGGEIDSFALGLNAHVSHHNTDFTVFGDALHNAAGVLLPIIVGVIAIFFYNFNIKFIGYHICYLSASISLIASALAWVFIPVISIFMLPPQGDDVTKFLNVSGINPLFVSFGALLIIGFLIYISYKKGIYKKIKEIFASFAMNRKINLKQKIIMALGLFFCAVIMFLFINNVSDNSVVLNMSFSVVNALEEKSWECQFNIKRTKTYSVDLNMKAQGFITAVRIIGEAGELMYQNLGENSSFTFSVVLNKGNYKLSLTYLADYEAVREFLKNTGQEMLSSDDIQYVNEVFKHDNNDYSADFSIRIR